MPTKKTKRPKGKINPAAAVPQAPRALRTGSRPRAAEPQTPEDMRAKGDDEDPDDDDPDEEEDDEDDDRDQDEHDAHASTYAEACRAAADAAEATKGNDSAEALMGAEQAHDMCAEHGLNFKASCMKMRGAAPEMTPPAPATARALSALAGPQASSQMELAQLAAFGRRTMTALGATTIGAAEVKLPQAVEALREIAKVRGAADLTERVGYLTAAVHAGLDRAKAFAIDKDGKLGKPLAVWMRGAPGDVRDTLATMGYAPGAGAARSTLIIAPPPDLEGEAGLAARAKQSGMTLEERRLAEENQRRSAALERGRYQENPR